MTPEFFSFTETLMVGGDIVSISLCGHEISATANGSMVKVVLQITSLAGADMFGDYKTGWTAALSNLAALAMQPTDH